MQNPIAQSTFRTSDGIELSYDEQGAGLPILALAGLTRNRSDFDYLLQHELNCRLIRLDSRGRGQSHWAAPTTYTVAQETMDALALLDHLKIERAAILGTSRGGLIGMVVAAMARPRLLGLCLNDVGPVLEMDGLRRIAQHVGVPPEARNFDEAANRLAARAVGFANVSAQRWLAEAQHQFRETETGITLSYDPALKDLVQASLAAPLPDLWPMFAGLAGLPLVLIRGANSELLSSATAEAMRQQRPDMIFAEVPDRGHVPFLDEPESLAAIKSWISALSTANTAECLKT